MNNNQVQGGGVGGSHIKIKLKNRWEVTLLSNSAIKFV